MKTIQTICLLLIVLLGYTQEAYYKNPVKIPMLLSGSFAELRTNHFHSGIDIKTQGVTGLPIYSAAEGYISRIAVSPSGFGKALYIKHPNGTTTVYAHLKTFNSAISKYVKSKQYEQQSFRVDLEVPEYLFPVKQNEEIAKSGNSGSSGGPHLHFEIRDTQTEEPLNPLKHNFPVIDNIAPKIFSLLLVPLNQQSHVNYEWASRSYPIVFYDGQYHLKNNPSIPVFGQIGVAIQCNDYFDGSYNKCGINQLEMKVDDETCFMFQLNRFSFANSRYINSHIVYEEYKKSRRKFIKTWKEPGNNLPIYNHNGSSGIITPLNEIKQHVEVEVQDTYGNKSALVFNIVGKTKSFPESDLAPNNLFVYSEANRFETDSLQLIIPNGALYSSFNFNYRTTKSPKTFFSNFHHVHNNTIPLHKSATLKIKPHHLPDSLRSKVIIASVADDGEFSAMGGEYKNGWVETKTRALGTYSIAVDTVPPSITPLSIKDNALTESSRIRFKIKDDLAGIKTITGTLNGEWILFDYDAKTQRITHYFDKERFVFNKRHSFKLVVSDYRGNTSVYESSFWK